MDLSLPGRRRVSDVPSAPGSSVLDGVIEDLAVLDEGSTADDDEVDAHGEEADDAADPDAKEAS